MTHKSIALEFISRLAQKRAADAFELLSDSATWWYQSSLGGDGAGAPKAKMQQNLAALFDNLAGPFRMDVVGVTAEGERVAVEIAGDTRTKKGTAYCNTYHLLFIVRNDRIAAVREYCDTALTLRIISELMD